MLNTIKDKITQLISGKTVPIPIKCSTCGNETTDVDLKENFMVCPNFFWNQRPEGDSNP